MAVDDEVYAAKVLKKVGYYRLAAYWHPFREDVANGGQDDTFVGGTTFECCLQFYLFDKSLRILISDPLERLEVALRAQLADVIGSRDPHGHRKTAMMNWRNTRFPHRDWLAKQDKYFQKSRAEFAHHFRKKYAGHHPPIWIAKEVWDWGITSHLINGLRGEHSNAVARYFSVPEGRTLGSWTKSLNALRNECAHHSRVWNRGFTLFPTLPNTGACPDLDHLQGGVGATGRLYPLLAILVYLCKQTHPNTTLGVKVRDFILENGPSETVISSSRAGFPDGWENEALWN